MPNTWMVRFLRVSRAVMFFFILAFMLGVHGALAVNLGDPALVGCWRMDNNWTDASGNGNNGTAVNGATFSTTARVGSHAGSFDGVNDFVDIPTSNSLNITNQITVEAWVYIPSSVSTSVYLPILAGDSNTGCTNPWNSWMLYIPSWTSPAQSAVFVVSDNISGHARSVVSPTTVPRDVWVHLAGTYDGTTLNIYENGVLKKSEVFAASQGIGNPADIQIGESCSSFYSGLLDDVAVYKRALTAAEIKTSYTEGLGRIAYWQMDNDWTDASGNGNNGTAYSGATFSTNARVGSHAGSFDGVDDYVAPGSSHLTSAPNTFTIEFWASPTGTRTTTEEINSGISGTSGQRYAIGPGPGGTTNAGAGISVGTNGISVFERADGYLPSPLVYDTPLSDWNHIVVVYENKQPRLYLNGRLVKTGLTSQRANVYPSLVLGNIETYGPYQGLLDEVAIYKRALTGAEINKSYNDGLGRVGYWRMDNNWTDASGNATNGTAVSGATFSTNARVGSHAGSFDGVDDFVDLPTVNSLNITNQVTIAAWVNIPSSVSTGIYLPILAGDSNTGCNNPWSSWMLYIPPWTSPAQSAVFVVSDNISGHARSVVSPTTVPRDVWVHLAGTYDGTTLNIYENGVLKNSQVYEASQGIGNPATIRIGKFCSTSFYGGLLDEIAIYRRALTASEIAAIYSNADTTPSVGSISIDNGASATKNIAVTLTLNATDTQSGVSHMQFSNDNITWSSAEPYATTKSWTLTSGDGTKTGM